MVSRIFTCENEVFYIKDDKWYHNAAASLYSDRTWGISWDQSSEESSVSLIRIQSEKSSLATIEIHMLLSLNGMSDDLILPRWRYVNKFELVEIVKIVLNWILTWRSAI